MNNDNRNNFGNNNEDRFSTLDIDGINDLYYQDRRSASPNNNKPNRPHNSTPDLAKIIALLASIIVLIIIVYTAVVGILSFGDPGSDETTTTTAVTLPTTASQSTSSTVGIIGTSGTTKASASTTVTTKATTVTTNKTSATTEEPIYNPAYENAVIFIDAGHGGKDVGAVGELNGAEYYEKDINLSVSLLVREELEKRGFTVVMSRDTDEFIELAERVDMANAAKADMFVSLHCNSAVPAAYGTRILYTDRSVSYKKIKFAGYFEKAIEGFANLYDKMRKDVFVRSDKEESGYYLAVLRDTKMPSVLIEMGFITNENDLKMFISEWWQLHMARAVADAIENAYNAGIVTK